VQKRRVFVGLLVFALAPVLAACGGGRSSSPPNSGPVSTPTVAPAPTATPKPTLTPAYSINLSDVAKNQFQAQVSLGPIETPAAAGVTQLVNRCLLMDPGRTLVIPFAASVTQTSGVANRNTWTSSGGEGNNITGTATYQMVLPNYGASCDGSDVRSLNLEFVPHRTHHLSGWILLVDAITYGDPPPTAAQLSTQFSLDPTGVVSFSNASLPWGPRVIGCTDDANPSDPGTFIAISIAKPLPTHFQLPDGDTGSCSPFTSPQAYPPPSTHY
jgi:hypothetical protein